MAEHPCRLTLWPKRKGWSQRTARRVYLFCTRSECPFSAQFNWLQQKDNRRIEIDANKLQFNLPLCLTWSPWTKCRTGAGATRNWDKLFQIEVVLLVHFPSSRFPSGRPIILHSLSVWWPVCFYSYLYDAARPWICGLPQGRGEDGGSVVVVAVGLVSSLLLWAHWEDHWTFTIYTTRCCCFCCSSSIQFLFRFIINIYYYPPRAGSVVCKVSFLCLFTSQGRGGGRGNHWLSKWGTCGMNKDGQMPWESPTKLRKKKYEHSAVSWVSWNRTGMKDSQCASSCFLIREE